MGSIMKIDFFFFFAMIIQAVMEDRCHKNQEKSDGFTEL